MIVDSREGLNIAPDKLIGLETAEDRSDFLRFNELITRLTAETSPGMIFTFYTSLEHDSLEHWAIQDRTGKTLFASRGLASLLKTTPAEIERNHESEFIPDYQELRQKIAGYTSSRQQGQWNAYEAKLKDAQENLIDVSIKGIPIIDLKTREYQYTLVKIKDITQELAERIVDSLTELYNKKYTESELKRAIAVFIRSRERSQDEEEQHDKNPDDLCLAIADLDKFKVVNDHCGGHPQGDRVLKSIAKLFRTKARQEDTAGRWGGEEFSFVLPRTSKDEGLELLNRLQEELRIIEPLKVTDPDELIPDGKIITQNAQGDMYLNLSCTFGIVSILEIKPIDEIPEAKRKQYVFFDEHGQVQYDEVKYYMDEIMKLADARLYLGKKRGRNIIISKDG